eukprot:438689-Amphidinium_carterae.1
MQEKMKSKARVPHTYSKYSRKGLSRSPLRSAISGAYVLQSVAQVCIIQKCFGHIRGRQHVKAL